MESGSVYSFGVSSEELLRRCQDGDEGALRELLRRHERAVYSVLYQMLRSHDDAEEALADVFVKVWRAAASFRGKSKFTTWLYRIAANTARDFLRSRRARPEIAVEDVILTKADLSDHAIVDPEEALVKSDELAGIEMAMQKLAEGDRLLITLYHMRECSLEEIAEITGHSRVGLRVKLLRARRRLRMHLDHLEQETKDEMRAGTTESIGLQPRPPE